MSDNQKNTQNPNPVHLNNDGVNLYNPTPKQAGDLGNGKVITHISVEDVVTQALRAGK